MKTLYWLTAACMLFAGCQEHNVTTGSAMKYANDVGRYASVTFEPGEGNQQWGPERINTIGKVILRWDRPYLVDRVWIEQPECAQTAPFLGGLIQFSDGSNLHLGDIEDETIPHTPVGKEVRFSPKMVTWIEVYVTSDRYGKLPVERVWVQGEEYTGISSEYSPYRWESPIPLSCPFEGSRDFAGIEFTGRYRNYTNGDTWYPTWAQDGHLYTPWTDGYIDKAHEFELFDISHPGYSCHSCDIMGKKAATAQARISGKDPMDLRIENLPPRIEGNPTPYGGRYPCGSLIHDGVWYYGTYCLTHTGYCGGVGWTELGPFVGFRYSTDYGKTWIETEHTPESSLFGENPDIAKVRIGAPHFVDFGKNMEHSPDGYAYLVAQGSRDSNSCNNWIQADDVYLLRVKPSPATINETGAYEFFSGYAPDGTAKWTSDLVEIAPLLTWPGHLGCVNVTYNPGLGKYLTFITRGVRHDRFDTMALEAGSITGPWRIIEYFESFGPVAYFVNMPTKFISPDGKTGWLCYSANFHLVWPQKHILGNPAGSHYSMSLHEIRLLTGP